MKALRPSARSWVLPLSVLLQLLRMVAGPSHASAAGPDRSRLDFGPAIREYTSVIKGDPTRIDAYANRGLAYVVAH